MILRPVGELKAVLSTLQWAGRGKSGLQAAVGTSYEFGSPLSAAKFTLWPSKLTCCHQVSKIKRLFHQECLLCYNK